MKKIILSAILFSAATSVLAEPFLFISANDFGWMCRSTFKQNEIIKSYNRDHVRDYCYWNKEVVVDAIGRSWFTFSFEMSNGTVGYLGYAHDTGRVAVSETPVNWGFSNAFVEEKSVTFAMFPLQHFDRFVTAPSRYDFGVTQPISYTVKHIRTDADVVGSFFIRGR